VNEVGDQPVIVQEERRSFEDGFESLVNLKVFFAFFGIAYLCLSGSLLKLNKTLSMTVNEGFDCQGASKTTPLKLVVIFNMGARNIS